MNHQTIASIRADDLKLVAAMCKYRRFRSGRSPQLCALTETPTIQVACREQLRYSADFFERAKKYGISPARVMPMQRGDIGRLFDRVKCERGRAEVVKTWGVGIRALKAEPQYVLNGGEA